MISHFLQLHTPLARSTMKLCSPFFTSNLVSEAQQANHLPLPTFFLCSLLQILGQSSDSTLIILFLFCWNLLIRYNLMSSSCKQKKPTSQCMQQGIQLTKLCKFHLPKSKNTHTMLMMGFPLNFSILLLKLSHMLLMTVSLKHQF